MAVNVFEFDALIMSNDKVKAGFIEFPYDVRKDESRINGTAQ